jgi:hypothetical protein
MDFKAPRNLVMPPAEFPLLYELISYFSEFGDLSRIVRRL